MRKIRSGEGEECCPGRASRRGFGTLKSSRLSRLPTCRPPSIYHPKHPEARLYVTARISWSRVYELIETNKRVLREIKVKKAERHRFAGPPQRWIEERRGTRRPNSRLRGERPGILSTNNPSILAIGTPNGATDAIFTRVESVKPVPPIP